MEGDIACCLESVTSGLKARESGGESSVRPEASSCPTIFRIPKGRRRIKRKAEEPELVAIGPYHRGKDRLCDFEEHKWFFLKNFLNRTEAENDRIINSVAEEARSAWGCYSEPRRAFDCNFMKMMLLDGCFVVELLLQICGKEAARAPILTRKGIIPILIRDLLKLDNQVPYSLLQSLFECSISTMIEVGVPHVGALALKVFGQTYPMLCHKHPGLEYFQYNVIADQKHKHLLDLFYFALFVADRVPQKDVPSYRPSVKSIPCVTQLRPCGIKFKSKETKRFLDISFRKPVLEIPSITVDDFMDTVLMNCIALEQCQESSSKPITDYVSFMHCLINEPKDVSLLCSDGIIKTFSHDDQYVVDLFNKLVKSIVFNVQGCYLSKQFKELELYYYSNWASLIRTYFSSPWAAISVFSAFFIIALTFTQTVFAVLGHYSR